MADWAADLFGMELLTKDGRKSTKDVIFDAYKNYSAGDIEVVFVSSDRDQASFDGYFGEQPWTALPFEDRERKAQISSKFGVQGIPMLIVLSGADGTIIKPNGRSDVQSTRDLGKSLASWLPQSPTSMQAATHWSEELLGQFICTKEGKKEAKQVVDGKKVVILYFSAHWCPPCRGFTPLLADAYKKYNAGDIEVIFVSGDNDRASFDAYFGEMPWTAVPFQDRGLELKMSERYNVDGIPTVVVLNGEDGKVITTDGCSEVQSTRDLGKCLALWMGGSTPTIVTKKSQCCAIL